MTQDKDAQRLIMQLYEEECYINPLEKVEYPLPAISFGTKAFETKDGLIEYPIPVGTYGNFSFVQAPPKSKKTFFISLLSAVYLNDEINGISGDLKGNRQGKHLIHFDTEQGNFHASLVFKRPMEMSGNKIENYHTYALRQLSAKDRIDFIEYCLYDKLEGKDVGVVIIDEIGRAHV